MSACCNNITNVTYYAAMLSILVLCCNMIHSQSFIASFANDGLCCESPANCSITDCGFLNEECCRLNDDYICNKHLNDTTFNNSIYEGFFTIPTTDNIENNVYFRLYPDHMYFEYKLPSNHSAIGISWRDYNHPQPDLHFTIFASDAHADDDKWRMFDMLAQEDTYRIWSTNTEYECDSLSGYCLPDRLLNFNYQAAYNIFDFTHKIDANESVFVWERKYSIDNGLYDYNELYQSIHNQEANKEICWNYAIFEGNIIGNGGEKINSIETMCSTVQSICEDDEDDDGDIIIVEVEEDRMCAMNKVDLVIINDITLSHNVWNQLQEWIENLIIDIHHKLVDKEEAYALLHDNIATDILFRVSFIAYCDEYFDVIQILDSYNWGNQKVLLQNLMYDMDEIIIKPANRSTTAQLKSALHVASTFVFPTSGSDDILFTLLVTDEVATRDEDKPCLDTQIVDVFNEYDAIFGAVFIDEAHDDTLLPLFVESIDCLLLNHSNSYTIMETNSSVEPSSSFHSFYDFIDNMNVEELKMDHDICDSMVNVTWPTVEFEDFIPLSECVATDMDLVFIIDLTPKNQEDDCFSCWIDSISSVIMNGFELVQNVTSFTSSLHIAIVTFDGITVNIYNNLNDPSINSYARLSQIFSLLESLVPVIDEYDHVSFEDAIAEVNENVVPYKSTYGVSQSLFFVDPEAIYVANQNTSYRQICTESNNMNLLYFIHDYQALQHNLFPLYYVDCMSSYSVAQQEDTIIIYGGNHEDILNQLYISMSHIYCPQECHDCDIPLFDESKDLQTTLLLSNWALNKPITSGWNISTSEYSFQEIIKSVDVYIYGLEAHHFIQISLYDPAANEYIAQSMKYPGDKDTNRYSIELPLKNQRDEYNYLLPNHQYSINIRLHNITKKDTKSIQMVLQNVTQNMYYEAQSHDHFTNINGLLYIYWEKFPFNVANHAVSTRVPFGNICIVCVGADDTIPLLPTTAIPTITPTSLPTSMPFTSSTVEPSVVPTDIPSITPSNTPTYLPSETPTNEPTFIPSETPTNTPTKRTTAAPITTTIATTTPTSSPLPQPTERECPAVVSDDFCIWTCNEENGNHTEWQLEFLSFAYNPSTDLTTFHYKASTLDIVPDAWCNSFHNKIQRMTIIFLYASTCCELASDSQQLRNITLGDTSSDDADDEDITLWGIHNDHWIFYPFRLSAGESTHFTLTLKGEHIITKGTYVASHKSWFDGSRPTHRCGLNTVYVPDVCELETRSPTTAPIASTTASAMSTDTVITSVSPTNTPSIQTTEDQDDCPTLAWPDLQDDCEQYCKSSESNVEWNMAHISTLYNSLSDTTTIAWSVTIESNHWVIDDWCFPISFNPRFNYPERLKRILIRLNPCCSGQISSTYLKNIIEGVSDDGDFSIIVDEYDMVTALEWDEVHLRKGKTGMFFVSFQGNITLIDGDYWFFGGNSHSRCTSNEVQVPDVCGAFLVNDYDFVDDETETNPNADKDWYLEWFFRVDSLNNNQRRMQYVTEDDNDLFRVKQWMDKHHRFLCNDWMQIIHVNEEYVKMCNASIVFQDSTYLYLYLDIIADQNKFNETQVVRLQSEFEHNTTERDMAQRLISNDIIAESGVQFKLECDNFVVKEIDAKQYYNYNANEAGSVLDLHTTSSILGVIAMIIIVVIYLIHKYYNKQTHSSEHKPHLIHQIEDLFIKEWYQNNRQNSEKQNKIHEKLMHVHVNIADCNNNENDDEHKLSPIMEHDKDEEDDDDDGSSISNLSSNDTEHDDISLEIGWNEYKL